MRDQTIEALAAASAEGRLSLEEYAQRSEAAGAEAIWFPDHLMGFWPQSLWTPDVTPLAEVQPSPHVFFDPFVAMASAGAATSRVRLATPATICGGRSR